MRFSIFTPTHKADYLLDVFESLTKQTFNDWEWVLIPNGKKIIIPNAIRAHPQVRIIPAPKGLNKKGIGALKQFACSQCAGDYLVELDHDDLLTPDALEVIHATAINTGAGFIYSDFSNFYPNDTCQVFGNAYGWQHYPVQVADREYTAMRAFATNPSSLHQIYYAPNHVRVWSREAYLKTGGHDPKLHVVDDHDLLCRTYLAGVEFAHIPQCLYLYRLQANDQNSYLQMNADIQTLQHEVANKYIYQLVMEWCRRNAYPMVDLNQTAMIPGFITLPSSHDFKNGIPLPDNSVGCIRAYDVLQQVRACQGHDCDHGTDGEDLCIVGIMNEIYRVLVPGGWLFCGVPASEITRNPVQMVWNNHSFLHFTDQNHAKYIQGLQCRFQESRIWQAYASDWHEQNDRPHIYANLVALKGQEQPGIISI